MPLPPVIVYFSLKGSSPPKPLVEYVREQEARLVEDADVESVILLVNRGHPAMVVLDGRQDMKATSDLIEKLRGDSFSSIFPVIVWADKPISATSIVLSRRGPMRS